MNLESSKVTVAKSTEYLYNALLDIKNFEKELVNYVSTNELGKEIYNIIHETHELPKGNEIDQLLVEFKKAR